MRRLCLSKGPRYFSVTAPVLASLVYLWFSIIIIITSIIIIIINYWILWDHIHLHIILIAILQGSTLSPVSSGRNQAQKLELPKETQHVVWRAEHPLQSEEHPVASEMPYSTPLPADLVPARLASNRLRCISLSLPKSGDSLLIWHLGITYPFSLDPSSNYSALLCAGHCVSSDLSTH